LKNIESNQLEKGKGDGSTSPDFREAQLGTSDTEFLLRSERSGEGDRVYTLIYSAKDGSDNEGALEIPVVVPHDLRSYPPNAVDFHDNFKESIQLEATKIRFSIPVPYNTDYLVSLVDISGRKRLEHRVVSSSYHLSETIDMGGNLAGGIYWLVIKSVAWQHAYKVVLLK